MFQYLESRVLTDLMEQMKSMPSQQVQGERASWIEESFLPSPWKGRGEVGSSFF